MKTRVVFWTIVAVHLVLICAVKGDALSSWGTNLTGEDLRLISTRVISFNNPENVCVKFPLGANKFITCGYDNAGKIMVDDCEYIGFKHSWTEKEEMTQTPGTEWHEGPGGVVIIGPGYTTRRTRKCQNCTIEEEEYNEVTKKWRRK